MWHCGMLQLLSFDTTLLPLTITPPCHSFDTLSHSTKQLVCQLLSLHNVTCLLLILTQQCNSFVIYSHSTDLFATFSLLSYHWFNSFATSSHSTTQIICHLLSIYNNNPKFLYSNRLDYRFLLLDYPIILPIPLIQWQNLFATYIMQSVLHSYYFSNCYESIGMNQSSNIPKIFPHCNILFTFLSLSPATKYDANDYLWVDFLWSTVVTVCLYCLQSCFKKLFDSIWHLAFSIWQFLNHLLCTYPIYLVLYPNLLHMCILYISTIGYYRMEWAHHIISFIINNNWYSLYWKCIKWPYDLLTMQIFWVHKFGNMQFTREISKFYLHRLSWQNILSLWAKEKSGLTQHKVTFALWLISYWCLLQQMSDKRKTTSNKEKE